VALPRISIVTSSYNQGRFIGATIESVLEQHYPNLEHIVVDGMSSDETPQVLARYPHLRVVREPDRGQADAINKGFRQATGEIYSFLNSDDLLLPGALHRVAAEMDPARGRHVVMGRCRFIDERGAYTGIEHPSRFEGLPRLLAVWKGHWIPQPAVFFTAQVWQECGPLQESLVLDYDLFCRFARRYHFHAIDQPLAAYRLHAQSKTSQASDRERLERCIEVSKRYWGPRTSALYWRLAGSLLLYRLNRQGRANRLLARAFDGWQRGRWGAALASGAAGALLAPEVVANVAILPGFRLLERKLGPWRLWPRFGQRGEYPQTMACLDRNTPWDDGWVGPHSLFEREARGGERTLILQGNAIVRHLRQPLSLTACVDGEVVLTREITASGHFCLTARLKAPLNPGLHRIEIRASPWWVPHRLYRSGDYRPLCWRSFGQDSILLRP